jgi:hypothetical protein
MGATSAPGSLKGKLTNLEVKDWLKQIGRHPWYQRRNKQSKERSLDAP